MVGFCYKETQKNRRDFIVKIKEKAYYFTLTFFVLPLLLVSFWVMYAEKNKYEELLDKSMEIINDDQMKIIESFSESEKKHSEIISVLGKTKRCLKGNVSEKERQNLKAFLSSHLKIFNYKKSIAIVDAKGNIVSASEGYEHYDKQTVEKWIECIQGKEFFISDVVEKKDGEKFLVSIYPIKENEKVLGYVLSEIYTDFYSKLAEAPDLWESSTFYIVDSNEVLISAYNSKGKIKNYVTKKDERKQFGLVKAQIDFEKNPKGDFEYEVLGKKYVTFYSDVNNTKWRLFLSIDKAAYNPGEKFHNSLMMIIILICIVFFVAITKFFESYIIKPINTIINVLGELQKSKNYALRIPLKVKNEMGILIQEVNELISFAECEHTKSEEDKQILKEKSETDSLTQVLNRETFRSYCESRINRLTEYIVLFIDVDDFKAFNTKYGHLLGDHILIFVAQVLKDITGEVVGRAGGDEFVVFIENETMVKEIESTLQYIQDVLNKGFYDEKTGKQMSVKLSIGATYVKRTKEEIVNFENLIEMSDAAMYTMKKRQKGGYVLVRYFDKQEKGEE